MRKLAVKKKRAAFMRTTEIPTVMKIWAMSGARRMGRNRKCWTRTPKQNRSGMVIRRETYVSIPHSFHRK